MGEMRNFKNVSVGNISWRFHLGNKSEMEDTKVE